MKTVIVTGGNRGLGLAVTDRLIRENYHVIVVARTFTDELSKLIGKADGMVNFESCDLSKTDEIHSFVRQICSRYGAIWGLVNNAALGIDAVLATQHISDINLLIQVNLLAPILLTKSVSRSMLAAGEGRIINISSVIATTGFTGLSVYGATKAGLIGFSKSLARELGKVGITVNAVCPGYMQTEMTALLQSDKLQSIIRRSPLGRLATVDDVAGAIAFLLGPDGGAITGSTLTVDAGSSA